MRIIICGAGIGGLTLAHALRGHADVMVLERDAEPGATGGYRLHLDAAAYAVLARVLPADLWADIRAVSDAGTSFSQFTIADDRLRPIVIEEQDPAEDRLLCSRVALRVLLATRLGDMVHFDSQVSRVMLDGHRPSVLLSTGEELTADVVVGAEGGSSPTVAALAGAPTAYPTGLHGLAGRTPLDGAEVLPPFLDRGPALALSGPGTGLFLSLTGTGNTPVPVRVNHLAQGPALVWGVIARRDALPPQLPDTGEDLAAVAAATLGGWAPSITGLVARSDPGSVAAYAFRAADPAADLTPWTSGVVTAIGDAVHGMPPTGGRAAATAIRDAGFLAGRLRDRPPTPDGARAAIAEYERAMPSWAVPAVRESMGPVRVIRALRHRPFAALARPALRAGGRLGRWRYGQRS